MNLNLKSMRRHWTRVKNATVHQTNSVDANVMLELLDRLEAAEENILRTHIDWQNKIKTNEALTRELERLKKVIDAAKTISKLSILNYKGMQGEKHKGRVKQAEQVLMIIREVERRNEN